MIFSLLYELVLALCNKYPFMGFLGNSILKTKNRKNSIKKCNSFEKLRL